MATRTCKECGKTFEPFKNQLYCSVDCKKKNNQRKMRAKSRENAHESFCPNCGKKFKHNNHNRVFCSDECRHEFDEDPLKERYCRVCGKLFKPTRKDQKFCSNECYFNRPYKQKDPHLFYKIRNGCRKYHDCWHCPLPQEECYG